MSDGEVEAGGAGAGDAADVAALTTITGDGTSTPATTSSPGGGGDESKAVASTAATGAEDSATPISTTVGGEGEGGGPSPTLPSWDTANPASLAGEGGDAADPASAAEGGGDAANPPSRVHMQKQINALQWQREAAFKDVLKIDGVDPQQLAMMTNMVAAQRMGMMQQMSQLQAEAVVKAAEQSSGKKKRRRKGKKSDVISEAMAAASNDVGATTAAYFASGMNIPGNNRTLNDLIQSEGFYKKLCEEKDKKISSMQMEIEDQNVIIGRLRVELVRALEAMAVKKAPDPEEFMISGEELLPGGETEEEFMTAGET